MDRVKHALELERKDLYIKGAHGAIDCLIEINRDYIEKALNVSERKSLGECLKGKFDYIKSKFRE